MIKYEKYVNLSVVVLSDANISSKTKRVTDDSVPRRYRSIYISNILIYVLHPGDKPVIIILFPFHLGEWGIFMYLASVPRLPGYR